MGRTIILCPLEIECVTVARAVRAARRTGDVEIRRAGPGPIAIARAMDDVERAEPPELVILAGVAGATRAVGHCPSIVRIIDGADHEWRPARTTNGGEPVTLLAADEPILGALEKRRLGERAGAALIDTESHAFAERSSAAGLNWCVVRVVSDGPDDDLPLRGPRWIDERGRTRTIRAVFDVLTHPGDIGPVLALSRRTRRALSHLEGALRDVLTGETALIEPARYHGDL